MPKSLTTHLCRTSISPNNYSIQVYLCWMRPKDLEKRAAIKEAIFAMVAEPGAAALKVADLARKVGIAPSTLYVYFKDKKCLILTLWTKVMQPIVRQMRGVFDPQRPYKNDLWDTWIHYWTYRVQHFNEISLYEQVKAFPYHKVASENKSAAMETSLEIIRFGKAQKLLKDHQETMLLAVLGGIAERLTLLFVQGELEMKPKNLNEGFKLMMDSSKA
jgi:TetR/AcrR family transcriptional regulator, multidrug resistance operon repressor